LIVGAAVAPAKAASLDELMQEVVRLQAKSVHVATCNADIVVQ
jgi:hypothetical protein